MTPSNRFVFCSQQPFLYSYSEDFLKKAPCQAKSERLFFVGVLFYYLTRLFSQFIEDSVKYVLVV